MTCARADRTPLVVATAQDWSPLGVRAPAKAWGLQAIPQYRELNQGMSLDAFKSIFWWEWTHRLIGRLIGAVFLLPLFHS